MKPTKEQVEAYKAMESRDICEPCFKKMFNERNV